MIQDDVRDAVVIQRGHRQFVRDIQTRRHGAQRRTERGGRRVARGLVDECDLAASPTLELRV